MRSNNWRDGGMFPWRGASRKRPSAMRASRAGFEPPTLFSTAPPLPIHATSLRLLLPWELCSGISDGERRMSLTRVQKRKVDQIKEIAELIGVDFWNVEKEPDNDVRNALLGICSDLLVRAGVVSEYVLIDELLSNLICNHFFDRKKTNVQLWRRKSFQNFNYYILEEMPLLRKLALASAIRTIPKPIRGKIKEINTVRNAIAHSFFPSNKREYKSSKKVLYKGQDVFTVEGMKRLSEDAGDVISYLCRLVYGV